MKLVTFTILTILLSVGYAFAGAGAPVPPGSQNAPSSGRPGAILDEAACQAVWTKAGGGDSLSYDQAGPYVTNLKQADPDDDGVFSKEEFVKACKMGWVQQEPSKAPGTQAGHQTPQNPTNAPERR